MTSEALTDALQETLTLFDGATPLTTSEVAERLDLGRRSTYDRLERLVDNDRLQTKKVGASARVWWRPRQVSTDTVLQPSGDSTLAESLVSDVFDTTQVGIFVLDDEFEVRWANETVKQYLGLDGTQLVGRDKRTLVTESVAPVVEEEESFTETLLATYDDNTTPEEFECHVTAGDDRAERWLEHHSNPIDAGAFAGGRVELYYDITTRKQTEPDAKQFDSLISAVEEYAIFMLDAEGHIQTWNAGAERIKGYSAEAALDEHVSIFYTEDDQAAKVPEQNLAAAARDGTVETNGWRVREDGTRFWANITLTAVYDDTGDLEGYVKVTRDMTGQREYEQQLHAEKAFIESLFENQRDVIYAFDADGQLLRWNDRLEEVSGYSGAQIAEMTPADFVVEDEHDELTAAAESVLDHGAAKTVELTLKDAAGETLPYEFTISPLTDSSEDIVGLTGIGRDISDRKQKERQLERDRDGLKEELEMVFDRTDEAMVAIDEQWRITHVNDRGASLLERSVGELLGQELWNEFPNSVDEPFQQHLERALETQDAVTFETQYPPHGRWFECTAHPTDSGLSIYFRDITRRKERERELERYETIIETVDDGIYVVDEHGYFTEVNEAYASMVGRSRDELIGSHVSVAVANEETVSEAKRLEEDLANDARETATLEAEFGGEDGTAREGEATFALMWRGYNYERVAVVRDVTERKRRERELELYETIVETVDDGIYALDEDAQFAMVNDAYTELSGYDRAELIGSHATMVYDDEIGPEVDSMAAEIRRGERSTASIEFDLHTNDGGLLPCEGRFAPFTTEDGHGRCGVVRDISERLAYERELETRVQQQEVVTDLGQRALEKSDLDELMAEASELVAETLDNDYCKVLDLDASADQLLLRQGVGWQDGIVGSATVSASEDDSQASYTLQTSEPVVVNDLETETRFSGPALLTDHDVRSGISTIIGSPDQPWGILGTHDTSDASFSEYEVNFVQSVANILGSAIARYDAEQELLTQREQLAALNSLNESIRQITGAVIDQSTRDEIEAAVCEQLADSESYQFAWVGDVDTNSQQVQLRTEAGVEGYLDDTVITVDPDDDRSAGPTGQAFLTGDIQTAQHEEESYEPWAKQVDQFGFRSSAAIPIAHEGTIYGVLNLYTERTNAFENEERAVIGQLGDVVGHAIAATERKQTLMSDNIVELEFRIQDVFDAIDIDTDGGGRISLNNTVSLSESEYLIYGRASADAVDTVRDATAAIPHWESVEFHDEDADTRFELRLSEPPVLSVVASVGGYVDTAVIDDGDYQMTIHVSPNVDHHRIIDTVQEAYPTAQLYKHRQISRDIDSIDRAHRNLTAELTERQQTVLEAAYHSGFFEWPRNLSGEDIATSLDIAAPTLHQHLRKAERKVFDSVLTSTTATES